MLSGARLLEMFDGDGGSALTVVSAAGLRQDHSRLLVRRAPQAVRRTTLDWLTKTPGGRGRARRPWTGSVTVSGSTLVCLGARSLGLCGAPREITEWLLAAGR